MSCPHYAATITTEMRRRTTLGCPHVPLPALTLFPLQLGSPPAWTVADAALPSLIGHLLYGASLALVLSPGRVAAH